MTWQAILIMSVLVAYLVFGLVSYWREKPMRSCCKRDEVQNAARPQSSSGMDHGRRARTVCNTDNASGGWGAAASRQQGKVENR
jgi:hypothetical protein